MLCVMGCGLADKWDNLWEKIIKIGECGDVTSGCIVVCYCLWVMG